MVRISCIVGVFILAAMVAGCAVIPLEEREYLPANHTGYSNQTRDLVQKVFGWETRALHIISQKEEYVERLAKELNADGGWVIGDNFLTTRVSAVVSESPYEIGVVYFVVDYPIHAVGEELVIRVDPTPDGPEGPLGYQGHITSAEAMSVSGRFLTYDYVMEQGGCLTLGLMAVSSVAMLILGFFLVRAILRGINNFLDENMTPTGWRYLFILTTMLGVTALFILIFSGGGES